MTITELTQTPLSEMRSDDIFGASGRETVTNTVVAKNIAVKRKMQEEAERTAEIDARAGDQRRPAEPHDARGQGKEERRRSRRSSPRTRPSRRAICSARPTSPSSARKKEQAEQAAEIGKQKAIEAAQVDKERTIEAALVDKQIMLTLKAKECAEADAQKAAALALKEKANQEVITVQQVAEAERQRQVAIVAAEREAQQEKIAADVDAYEEAPRGRWRGAAGGPGRRAGHRARPTR